MSGEMTSRGKKSWKRRWKHAKRRWRNRFLALVGPWILRVWMGSIRYRVDTEVSVHPQRCGREPHIYVLWHQRGLTFAYTHRKSGVRILTSKHSDGDLIAGIVDRLGLQSVRGSSTRGGVQAMRELLNDLGSGHDYAFTPDGPRGPLHVFQSGALYFASHSGLPLVPATVSYRRAWKLPTWDRFVIPWPFTEAVLRFGRPIDVPPELTSEEFQTWRRELETALVELTVSTDQRYEEFRARSIPWKEHLARVEKETQGTPTEP